MPVEPRPYAALILEAYEDEVAGAAYFDGLARIHPQHAQFLQQCAALERTTAQRLTELLRRHQLTPAPQATLDERGALDARRDAARDWMSLMEQSADAYGAYVAAFRALEALGPAEDQPALAALTAHEIQLIDWLRAEARS